MLIGLLLSLISVILITFFVTWLFSPSASKRAIKHFKRDKNKTDICYESKKQSMRDKYENLN